MLLKGTFCLSVMIYEQLPSGGLGLPVFTWWVRLGWPGLSGRGWVHLQPCLLTPCCPCWKEGWTLTPQLAPRWGGHMDGSRWQGTCDRSWLWSYCVLGTVRSPFCSASKAPGRAALLAPGLPRIDTCLPSLQLLWPDGEYFQATKSPDL